MLGAPCQMCSCTFQLFQSSQQVESLLESLHAPVLIYVLESTDMVVNLDPSLLEAIREADCLQRVHALTVPDAASHLLSMEEHLKTTENQLKVMFPSQNKIPCRGTLLVLDVTMNESTPSILWLSVNYSLVLSACTFFDDGSQCTSTLQYLASFRHWIPVILIFLAFFILSLLG